MVTSIPSGTSIFIIDTEQDASRFVGEMCAYITGRVGERIRGDEYAELYEQETNTDPIADVIDIPNGKDIMTPWSVWSTPGWFDNGVGDYYPQGSVQEAVDDYRRRVAQERTNLIRQKEAILAEIKTGKTIANWTETKALDEIERHKREIIVAQGVTRIPSYPAYLSVAIFFGFPPCEMTTDIMKVRAFHFVDTRKQVEHKRDTINITGFRLLKVQQLKKFTQLS